MLFFIGILVVFGSIVTGYLLDHGNLKILFQPAELIVIAGAAFGAFIVGNPKEVIKDAGKKLKFLTKGKPFNKTHYLELLLFLYTIFRFIKTKGLLELERIVDNPKGSTLFNQFPTIANNHHVLEFICDSLRLLIMGVDNHFQLEDLMDQELEIHHENANLSASALGTVGDGLPAFGIVAAVLGVINTMKSIDEPPAILGELIAGALVGTFTGVLLSYGLVSPISSFISKFNDAEAKYLYCIKAGIITHMQGNAPSITVEFVRKLVPPSERPSFEELESAINEL